MTDRVQAWGAAPPAVTEIFGPRLPTVERYVAQLAGPAVERGLIGPREIDRLWERHVLNCVVLEEHIPDQSAVIDIGSGAGLPGIPLAIARPDLEFTLLEPLLRRSRFLEECVAELALDNVQVVRGRAEEVSSRMTGDVVVARAVAPLERLLVWAIPLLRPGGVLLAMKGEHALEELRAAQPTIVRLGCADAQVVRAGQGKVDPATIVVRVVAGTRVRATANHPHGRKARRGGRP